MNKTNTVAFNCLRSKEILVVYEVLVVVVAAAPLVPDLPYNAPPSPPHKYSSATAKSIGDPINF